MKENREKILAGLILALIVGLAGLVIYFIHTVLTTDAPFVDIGIKEFNCKERTITGVTPVPVPGILGGEIKYIITFDDGKMQESSYIKNIGDKEKECDYKFNVK